MLLLVFILATIGFLRQKKLELSLLYINDFYIDKNTDVNSDINSHSDINGAGAILKNFIVNDLPDSMQLLVKKYR